MWGGGALVDRNLFLKKEYSKCFRLVNKAMKEYFWDLKLRPLGSECSKANYLIHDVLIHGRKDRMVDEMEERMGVERRMGWREGWD